MTTETKERALSLFRRGAKNSYRRRRRAPSAVATRRPRVRSFTHGPRKAWVSLCVLLVIGGCSPSAGTSRRSSKQDFYEESLRLAKASMHLVQHGELGDPRLNRLKFKKQQLTECIDRLTQLEDHIEVLKQEMTVHPSALLGRIKAMERDITTWENIIQKNKALRSQALQRDPAASTFQYDQQIELYERFIAGAEKDIARVKDTHLESLDLQVARLRDDSAMERKEKAALEQAIADREYAIEHDPYIPAPDALAEHLTISDLRKRLGPPDSIVKKDVHCHVWIYRFLDGSVHIVVRSGGLGDASFDMHRDDTKVRLDPHEITLY